MSHCFSIGPQQRAELYPIFQRWFGIALRSAKDLAILPDSLLGVNATRDEARRQEALRRRPHSDLLSIPPAVNAGIERRSMHHIAREIGEAHLRAVRERSASLTAAAQAERLRADLKPMLGDIEPAAAPAARQHWRRSLTGATVEAVSVSVEEGIEVPLLLLLPPAAKSSPVVVGVSQGGKERFLASRATDLESILQSGAAICLVDVRGAGETSPSHAAGENSALAGLAHREFDLARNLLGSRLKNLRTVLAYLRTRPELDSRRMAVWGESFALSNESPLFLDEIEMESGPQVQYRADPSGAHLALLAGLYEPEVQAVAARGGLFSYLSVLDDAFSYVPTEGIVLGVVKAGDIADIAAVLAPRPLILDSLIDGRNIKADAHTIKAALAATERADADSGSPDKLTVSQRGSMGTWLVSALKSAAPVR